MIKNSIFRYSPKQEIFLPAAEQILAAAATCKIDPTGASSQWQAETKSKYN
jgi:hypothetical protein